MRCLIVDDEEPARRELRQLLSLHPEMEVVGEAADVDAALEATNRLSPEVVFLDIKLAGETGFDYVARLAEPLPHIVFVTAYDRYAIRGFECNALDYLLKPVRPERLQETLSRLRLAQNCPAEGRDRRCRFSQGRLLRALHALARGSSHFVGRKLHPGLSERWNGASHHPAAEEMAGADPRGVLSPGASHGHRSARRHAEELRVSGGKRELVLSDGTALPVSRSHWAFSKVLDGTGLIGPPLHFVRVFGRDLRHDSFVESQSAGDKRPLCLKSAALRGESICQKPTHRWITCF